MFLTERTVNLGGLSYFSSFRLMPGEIPANSVVFKALRA